MTRPLTIKYLLNLKVKQNTHAGQDNKTQVFSFHKNLQIRLKLDEWNKRKKKHI